MNIFNYFFNQISIGEMIKILDMFDELEIKIFQIEEFLLSFTNELLIHLTTEDLYFLLKKKKKLQLSICCFLLIFVFLMVADIIMKKIESIR